MGVGDRRHPLEREVIVKKLSKEEVLQVFLQEDLIESTEIVIGDDYHCNSCSCSECERADADCVCQSNHIVKAIDMAFAED